MDAEIRCACGNVIKTRSTKPTIIVGICNVCHPFYTGQQKFVDTAGRVDKFQQRLAKTQAAQAARHQEKEKEVARLDFHRPRELASAGGLFFPAFPAGRLMGEVGAPTVQTGIVGLFGALDGQHGGGFWGSTRKSVARGESWGMSGHERIWQIERRRSAWAAAICHCLPIFIS